MKKVTTIIVVLIAGALVTFALQLGQILLGAMWSGGGTGVPLPYYTTLGLIGLGGGYFTSYINLLIDVIIWSLVLYGALKLLKRRRKA